MEIVKNGFPFVNTLLITGCGYTPHKKRKIHGLFSGELRMQNAE
jgi:hypothetical protein